MRTRFKIASGWSLALLDTIGADGLTLPWRTIYLRRACWNDPVLRAHEEIHIAQMDRDGTVRFCLRYLWQLSTRGYWEIDYEIEAYRDAPGRASAAAGTFPSRQTPPCEVDAGRHPCI